MSEDLVEQIVLLREAQEQLEKATERIEEHNIDEDAHADIREKLNKIIYADTVFTNEQKDQIHDLVKEELKVHTDKHLKEAHEGWNEIDKDLTTKFSEIEERITSIEAWMNGEDDDQTDLNQELQDIEDKYKVILDDLYSSVQKQHALGNFEAVETINKIISNTLAEKNQKILEVMEKYQTPSGGDVSDPSKRVVVSFRANGGGGGMESQVGVKGGSFILPACTFSPPLGKIFSYWSSDEEGPGLIVGNAGDRISLDDLESGDTELILFAIWTNDPNFVE